MTTPPAALMEQERSATTRTNDDQSFVTIRVTRAADASGRARTGREPLTLGLPFPRSTLPDVAALRLTGSLGGLPLQARVLNRWPDGSVRWALLDFQHGDSWEPSYRLTFDAVGPGRAAAGLTVSAEGARVRVDTGAAAFAFAPGRSLPFEQVICDGREVVGSRAAVLTVEDADGRTCDLEVREVTVEESGPVKAVVCLAATIRRDDRVLLDVITRVSLFAGLATGRVAMTVRNPRPAVHDGGYWELGDAGSVLLRQLALRMTLSARSADDMLVVGSSEGDAPFVTGRTPFELFQASSGGEHWQSPVHVDASGAVTWPFRGYRLRTSEAETTGLRATPHVALRGDAGWLSVAVPQFWQNFPKAISADGDALTVGVWPAQAAAPHEIQGGEQKTHVLFISVGASEPTLDDLHWTRQPSRAQADPSWYISSGAVPYLGAVANGERDQYRQLAATAIEGPHAFRAKAERIDEFGWRHFGELHADHEGARHDGPSPFVSHYNNQYDAVGAFALHFMQSGDRRWWDLMDDLAHHVADIDIYHTDGDKSAYSLGLFWHTSHYVDAGRSTHRSYPRHPKVGGGGLSNEHNYSTGLVLHHFLTGDPMSREAAIGLARWVVQMDDGQRTVFKWLAGGFTGLASQTASADYHGPGRGAGHSIRALIDGHVLTGDQVFLSKAEQIIRRTIHPEDDLEARRLLDRELRWSYTAYLQALGRYLDYKAELGQLDDAYAYAREALLRYARWMADHEYPYLDKPQELEFPTETWAAQDLRKSEVFDQAARHGSGAERARFVERAAFFWRTSLATLAAMPTHTFTRPQILILGHGFLRGYLERHPDDAAPAPVARPSTFGSPERFVTQKEQAFKRARMLVAGGALGAVVAAGLLVRWLFGG